MSLRTGLDLPPTGKLIFNTMKTIFAILAFCVAFGPLAAAAHSVLRSSQPANGEVMDASPSEVVLNFDKDIRVTAVRLGQGTIKLPKQSGFGDTITLSMPPVAPGLHTIEWRGLSADGHTMTGTVEFSVK